MEFIDRRILVGQQLQKEGATVASTPETPVFSLVPIGFEPYLQTVNHLLDRVDDAHGHTILVTGEAGAGKSRFISETKKLAAKRNLLVLESSCFEPDRTLPFAPLLDLLSDALRVYPTDKVLAFLNSNIREWACTIPEIESTLPAGTHSRAHLTEQDKRKLIHDLAQFFVRLSSIQPLLIVVEDLHWSDESTLDSLHYMARAISTQPIMVVLTYRSDEQHAALSHMLAELDRERLAVEVAIPRLSRAQVDSMLRSIFGLKRPVRAELLDNIFSLTGGNPYSVEEVLRSLAPDGDISRMEAALDQVPLSAVPVPRSIRDSVQRRLKEVSQAARQVVSLAAVAGIQFDFSLLQTLTRLEEDDLLSVIKELIDVQILVEESADGFAFRNALTRHAVYGSLLARERRALHRRIGDAIESNGADELNKHLPDLAYHFFEAGAWERALAYSERAGIALRAQYQPRVAVEQFTRALEACQRLDMVPDPRLYRLRGLVYETLGQFARACADQESALQVARNVGDRQSQLGALLDLGVLWSRRDYQCAGEYYRRAVKLAQQIGKPTAIARSLNRMGSWYVAVEEPDEAMECHRQALSLFEDAKDLQGVAETLGLLGRATYATGSLRESADYYERALTILKKLDDRRGLVTSLLMQSVVRNPSYLHLALVVPQSGLSENLDDAKEALRLARNIHWRLGEAQVLCKLAHCLGARGDYAGALSGAHTALQILEELDHQEGIARAHCGLGALYLDLACYTEAAAHLEQSLNISSNIGALYLVNCAAAFLARTLIQRGDLARAASVLESAAQPEAEPRTLGRHLLLCARAELALAQANPQSALTMVEQLSASTPATPRHVAAPLSMLKGDAFAMLNRWEEAESALRAACAAARLGEMPPTIWRAHLSLGKVLRSQSRDAEAAQEFAAAADLIEELGANIPADDPATAFQAAATSLLPRSHDSALRRVYRKEFGGLTARELDVARLIAAGMSNNETAERLVVSKRTVETHLSNILSKLGFSSRKQISSWAQERGLGQHESV
jgi:tetratricopeptide (TPR) repeat protein